MLRLSRAVCFKKTVIRNLVQTEEEVLEIPKKMCKFESIEN